METLIAQEDEGGKRILAQNERRDQWIADHVQANAEEPSASHDAAASSEGGMTETAQSAAASAPLPQIPEENVEMEREEEIVPIAELDDEAMEALRSTAGSENAQNDDQPEADAEMDEETTLEELADSKTERRARTPERPPAVKRRSQAEDDSMGDENKHRRIQDDATMSALNSVGEIEDMSEGLNEEDRKILAAVILGVDVTEIYSPVRVAAMAEKFGMKPGSSFDLTTGWDFTRKDHREKAWNKIKKEECVCL